MVINLKELFNSIDGHDDKVILKLLAAMKDNLLTDFDYLKFKHSYQSLQKMGMDEAKAAQSAFLTAATMGLTKEKLVSTAQHYKGVLYKEKEAFANALKYQIAVNVDGKRVELQKAKDHINENLKKIEQLKKENEILTSKFDQMENNIQISNSKIEETRDKFKSTFDALYEEINDDILLFDKIL